MSLTFMSLPSVADLESEENESDTDFY